MSRIDELKKQHPIYAMSAIDIYKMMSPNQSNKYIEMLIKLDKSMPRYRDEHRPELIASMVRWGLDYNYLETFDLETLSFVFCSMSNLMNTSRISAFNKFASFIDRKLIENTDVTSYSTWEEIEQAVALAEMKLIDKETAKQIKKVYEDDTWLSLRPLSLEASMKYGANTKWCTTTESGQYYARYSSRGILIYNINKKTGYKVACFKNLDSSYDNEFSWWDVADRKIEVLDSEVPSAVLEAIRNEIKTNSVTNQMLMTKAEADKLQLYKDGNYRPGKYNDGVNTSNDRMYITGGIIHHVESSGTTITSTPLTGTNTIYTYNPNTFTVNSSSTTGIGSITTTGMSNITTSNPNTQMQVHGDLEVNGNVRVNGTVQQYNHFEERPEGISHTEMIGELARRINGGDRADDRARAIESRQRLANEIQAELQPINEQIERRLFPELTNDDRAREAQQRLDNAISEHLAQASERVVEERRSFLDDIELGTFEQQMIERMQMLAGIETTDQRLARLDAERERIIADARRSEDEAAAELEAQREFLKKDIGSSVYEAEQPVVHLSLWNKIKNTGRRSGKSFINKLWKQIGV